MNSKSRTLSELAFCQIREDILNGSLLPGQKLQIEFLKVRFNIGTSPIREALNQLSAYGFIVKREQQGFYVADVDEKSLLELTNTRIWLDSMALRQSFYRDTKEWEERLIIGCHRLSKCKKSCEKPDSHASDEWRELHRSFHSVLVSNCGSDWLINFCHQLFDQFNRFRIIVLDRTIKNKTIDRREDIEHSNILNACLESDVDKTVTLLALHYKLSAEIILDRKLDLLKDPFRVVYGE